MIYKFVLLTGLVLTSTVFANETSSVHNRLIIAAIHDQKGFFNVRELHDRVTVVSSKLTTLSIV